MSMHKKPLSDSEREGLVAHGLVVDTPSQLSDCFRLGMAWQAKAKENTDVLEILGAVILGLCAVMVFALWVDFLVDRDTVYYLYGVYSVYNMSGLGLLVYFVVSCALAPLVLIFLVTYIATVGKHLLDKGEG